MRPFIQKGRRCGKTVAPDPAEIKALRRLANLTQSQAAELVYSSMRTWQEWEAGRTEMHPGLWELFQKKTGGFHGRGE